MRREEEEAEAEREEEEETEELIRKHRRPAKRSRKNATAAATAEHVCSECDAHFNTLKRLTEHKKRTHGPEAERTCPHCKKVFTNLTTMPGHLRTCPERPEVMIRCMMPVSNVPASPTTPHIKARSAKKGYVAVERYLARLVAFLEKGGFTYSSETRFEPLAALTITSYKSFVRKFLEAVVVGLVAGHGEGTLFLFFFNILHNQKKTRS